MSSIFLEQLNKSQLMDLINYVINKKANNIEENQPDIKRVEYIEVRSFLDNGDTGLSISAWDKSAYLGCFIIKDYKMKRVFTNIVTNEDFSDELREYLTSIFGEEYLNGLRGYYAVETEKEIARIQSSLGKGRS